jgi:hypothetical protein
MADTYLDRDYDDDADAYAAAFPRLNRKQRMREEPQEEPVDPELLEWAKREKTIIAEHAAARRVVR